MSPRFKSIKSYLLILLAASPLVAMSAEERIQPPTFGEQIRVIVEAHKRGEITYQEMMELRRELSGQFGREYETPQLPNCEGARRFLPKCMHRISTQNNRKPTEPAADPDSLDCGGLRKFTPACLSRPNPFETPSEEPEDDPIEQITDLEEVEPTATMAEEEQEPVQESTPKEARSEEKKPTLAEPQKSEVVIIADEPELNCTGLRKFTPKCLRRPDPFEEPAKETPYPEVEIAPERPEEKPPTEYQERTTIVAPEPQESEPVGVDVEKAITDEKVEEEEPDHLNCTGLRRFTLKCLQRPDAPEEPKKESADLEVEIAPEKPEATPPLETKVQESTPTQPQESEPVSITVDTKKKAEEEEKNPGAETTQARPEKKERITPELQKSEVIITVDEPELNCRGLRKFTVKCLRRPNPFEEPVKETADIEAEVTPQKTEAKPPQENKIQENKPAVTAQPEEAVSDPVTKVIAADNTEEDKDLNCTGLRRFTLKCRRKPDPPEKPIKESLYLEPDIKPEKPEE